MSFELELRSAVKALHNDLEAGDRGTENSWSVFGGRLANALQEEIRREVQHQLRGGGGGAGRSIPVVRG